MTVTEKYATGNHPQQQDPGFCDTALTPDGGGGHTALVQRGR